MPITRMLTSSSPSPSFLPLTNQTETPAPSPPPLRGLLSSLAPLALTITLTSTPLLTHAIPSPLSKVSPLPLPSTPYSQSQNLQLGLENGKIRPCPSTNPGCVSTNPRSSSFASPWVIPEGSAGNAVQALREGILKTQRNVNFKVDEDTPYGHYLQVEIDGGFGRDIMEFLVKRDVVAYRSIAAKVSYVYPFTIAVGDSRGQKERITKIVEELGWYAPNIESMDP